MLSASSHVMSSVPVTVHTNAPMEFEEQGCLLPLCPTPLAWQGKAGNARWDVTISFDYLLRKSVFGTLLLKPLPSHTLRTTPQTEYSMTNYMNLGCRAEKIKKGRLICCPSNPDYFFKPKFNFLIKRWKKFLQQHDYSWKKVQGTNKLPPPAPPQTVLAV